VDRDVESRVDRLAADHDLLLLVLDRPGELRMVGEDQDAALVRVSWVE
jgi:hypothetical protein